MTTYIYADLLFIINLLSDYLILFLTSRFTCSRTNLFRLLIASGTGAVFGTAVTCTGLRGALLFILIIAVSLIMCLIAFGKRRKRPFASLLFFFYLSSVLLYGGMYMALSFFSIIYKNAAENIGFVSVIILLLAVFFIYIVTSGILSRGVKNQSNNVKVEICDGRKTYVLDFLCDSGNLAKDPFSGKPVTIVSKNSVDSALVTALSQSFGDKETDDNYRHIKPRVIPLKTVSGTTLLYAFIPESMFVYVGRQKHRIDSIVAIDTHENAFFGKDGIIPGELLEML